MQFLDLLLIAVGLSMDAFAVSIGKGLSVSHASWRNALSVGIWFGGFQALMPLLGYLVIYWFSNIPAVQAVIMHVDHWVAFILLAIIGGNMLREALGKDDDCDRLDDSFAFRAMFVLAVATSIDALASGITFGCLENASSFVSLAHSGIWLDISVIGLTTFLFSVVGLLIGNLVGHKFHRGAELFGGLVLIGIGIKILVEHLIA